MTRVYSAKAHTCGYSFPCTEQNCEYQVALRTSSKMGPSNTDYYPVERRLSSRSPQKPLLKQRNKQKGLHARFEALRRALPDAHIAY